MLPILLKNCLEICSKLSLLLTIVAATLDIEKENQSEACNPRGTRSVMTINILNPIIIIAQTVNLMSHTNSGSKLYAGVNSTNEDFDSLFKGNI